MELYNYTSLEQELTAFEQMSEAVAVNLYNVDYKEEARQFIIDYWTYLA